MLIQCRLLSCLESLSPVFLGGLFTTAMGEEFLVCKILKILVLLDIGAAQCLYPQTQRLYALKGTIESMWRNMFASDIK